MSKKQTCKKCVFWKEFKTDDLSVIDAESLHCETNDEGFAIEGEIFCGQCLRFPPKVSDFLLARWERLLPKEKASEKGIISRSAISPITNSCDWCGEFKPKQKA